jgi:hypothetical protein
LRIGTVVPGRFHVTGRGRSFALVQGEPTENAHLAFPVGDRETLDAFRRVARAAGHPGRSSTGSQSERVLDPDGNEIEVVLQMTGLPPVTATAAPVT